MLGLGARALKNPESTSVWLFRATMPACRRLVSGEVAGLLEPPAPVPKNTRGLPPGKGNKPPRFAKKSCILGIEPTAD